MPHPGERACPQGQACAGDRFLQSSSGTASAPEPRLDACWAATHHCGGTKQAHVGPPGQC